MITIALPENGTFKSLPEIWFFGDQITFLVHYGCVILSFIEIYQEVLIQWIDWINWIISKSNHNIWKILFVLASYEYLERLKGKIRKCLFF